MVEKGQIDEAELARWESKAKEKSDILPSGWGWASTDRTTQQQTDKKEHPTVDKSTLGPLMRRIQ